MSSIAKVLTGLFLLIAASAATPDAAQAQSWRHEGWRGGGIGFGFGFGYPPPAYYPPVFYPPPPVYYEPRRYHAPRGYYAPRYAPRSYYAPPHCRTTRVRVWRNGHWQWRHVRRCY